jgi:hypothetical protein
MPATLLLAPHETGLVVSETIPGVTGIEHMLESLVSSKRR